MSLRLCIEPSFDLDRTGGVARVVEAQRRFLPLFDIQLVDDVSQAQVYIGHAAHKSEGPVTVPLRDSDGKVVAWTSLEVGDIGLAFYPWHRNAYGYAVRQEWGGDRSHRRMVFLHREILGLQYGDRRHADHKNRNRLDNRRSNLRVVTVRENNQNVTGLNRTSSYRGVSWDKPRCKWKACVQVDRKQIFIGRFDSEVEAADAAREARKRLLPYSVD